VGVAARVKQALLSHQQGPAGSTHVYQMGMWAAKCEVCVSEWLGEQGGKDRCCKPCLPRCGWPSPGGPTDTPQSPKKRVLHKGQCVTACNTSQRGISRFDMQSTLPNNVAQQTQGLPHPCPSLWLSKTLSFPGKHKVLTELQDCMLTAQQHIR
jgi:hypothetical protein